MLCAGVGLSVSAGELFARHVGVHLGALQTCVAEHLLNHAEIGAPV